MNKGKSEKKRNKEAIRISQEIEELRVKYLKAIQHKLYMREFMKKCIRNWENVKLSRIFR